MLLLICLRIKIKGLRSGTTKLAFPRMHASYFKDREIQTLRPDHITHKQPHPTKNKETTNSPNQSKLIITINQHRIKSIFLDTENSALNDMW